MSPVRLLSPEEVAVELERQGCRHVERLDSNNDVWVTPWDFHFIVPNFGDDRWCGRSKLFEILAEAEATRPNSH